MIITIILSIILAIVAFTFRTNHNVLLYVAFGLLATRATIQIPWFTAKIQKTQRDVIVTAMMSINFITFGVIISNWPLLGIIVLLTYVATILIVTLVQALRLVAEFPQHTNKVGMSVADIELLKNRPDFKNNVVCIDVEEQIIDTNESLDKIKMCWADPKWLKKVKEEI